MEIISNIALITINETLVVQLVSFLIFLFLINRIMIRPLRQTMDDRDRYIGQIQTDIVESGNQLEALINQIKEQEAAVRSEALGLAQEMEALGNEQATELFAAAREDVSIQIENAKAAVDAQIAEASKALKKESESLAGHIMENLLDRKLAQ